MSTSNVPSSIRSFLVPTFVFAIGALASQGGLAQALDERVQAFDPSECPASRCNLSEASYPFGNWTVRVVQAEPKGDISDGQRPSCKAWIELRERGDRGDRLKKTLVGGEIKAFNASPGLFVPPQQLVPGLFLIARTGGYENVVFAIHSNGHLDRIPGRIRFYDAERHLLFIATQWTDRRGRVTVIDEAGQKIAFDSFEIFPSTWFRLGRELYFTGERPDGTTDEADVAYRFDPARREFARRTVTPAEYAKATQAADGFFDLHPLRSCHSPTAAVPDA